MKTPTQRAEFAYEFFKLMRSNKGTEREAFMYAVTQVLVESSIEEDCESYREAARVDPETLNKPITI